MIKIKIVLTIIFSIVFLVSCGGGGSSLGPSDIADDNDTINDFADLEKILPYGLEDEDGSRILINALFYLNTGPGLIADRPLLIHYLPDIPVAGSGHVNEVCVNGGSIQNNVVHTLDENFNHDFTGSVTLNNCSPAQGPTLSGFYTVEGRIISEQTDTTKNYRLEEEKLELSKYHGRDTAIGDKAIIDVNVSGDFISILEENSDVGESSGEFTEESSVWRFSNGTNADDVIIRGYRAHSTAESETIRESFSVFTTTGAKTTDTLDYSVSWTMRNTLSSHGVVRAAGLATRSSILGFGFEKTFPEGEYNLQVSVLTPIIRLDPSDTLYPSEGVLLFDLKSHNISAIVTFNGIDGSKVAYIRNGVTKINNFDSDGNRK